jgi:type I restriction-modification system DNA methylase subunit
MSVITQNLRNLISDFEKKNKSPNTQEYRSKLATTLGWTAEDSHIEHQNAKGLPFNVTKGFIGNQPATIFVGSKDVDADLLNKIALFAYHNSTEWGVFTDYNKTVIFNSHWVRNNSWFQLPPIKFNKKQQNWNLLEAFSPAGVKSGEIDELALKFYEPDRQLKSVDDALVDRLDHWRDEILRYVNSIENIDLQMQNLFAQFFVLRAVEDRNLISNISSLKSSINKDGSVDINVLESIFKLAKEKIQSELFEEYINFHQIPQTVLQGIINDLYFPDSLPGEDSQYNFSWISADILGRAYEKYLSSLLVPVKSNSLQQNLFEQPIRDVARLTTARKFSGVYYTPSYLVEFITEKCLNDFYKRNKPTKIPRIADISCGSGSFLTAATDLLIRKLRKADPTRNWGKELIEKKCIVGVDIDARAVMFARLQLWLRMAEEPNPLPLPKLKELIKQGNSLSSDTWNELPSKYDLILGNPPFISSTKIEDKADLVNQFYTAQGRFDYSSLFVELAIRKLNENGILGLVLPNRLFKNRDGKSIREYLDETTNILSLIDFGANEVFSGTSAYIGTLIALKSQTKTIKNSRVIKVHSIPSRSKFLGAILTNGSSADTDYHNQYITAYDTQIEGDEWLLLSPSEKKARIVLQQNTESLDSIAGVNQGIKTGANDLFIVTVENTIGDIITEVRNGLGDINFIETDMLRPVIYGSDIRRYDNITDTKTYIIYPYRYNKAIPESDIKSKYPKTYEYFTYYNGLLKSRSSVTSKLWYELSSKRNETWLDSKKLLIRDLAPKTSFAIDSVSGIYLIGGTAIIPQDENLLLPLLAYLNSEIANWFLSKISSTFKSSFQKFEPQNLSRMPIPIEVINDHSCIEKLSELASKVIESKSRGLSDKQVKYETQINDYLYEMTNLTPQHITSLQV